MYILTHSQTSPHTHTYTHTTRPCIADEADVQEEDSGGCIARRQGVRRRDLHCVGTRGYFSPHDGATSSRCDLSLVPPTKAPCTTYSWRQHAGDGDKSRAMYCSGRGYCETKAGQASADAACTCDNGFMGADCGAERGGCAVRDGSGKFKQSLTTIINKSSICALLKAFV